ncbi:MAG: hypothetical protein JXR25_05070 [Pontiellaceae bacterium]|nr:hypothetical protein [Pontiellaceae bacterium]MBN2784179.1 hypothetical protein [Pontiellaceae bacterium]
MNGQEIVRKIEEIRALSGMISDVMNHSNREGRMVSLSETRHLDALSIELKRRLAELPEHPLRLIESPELKQRASDLLKEVQVTLMLVAHVEEPEQERQVTTLPKAAPARLKVYAAY